MQTDSPFARVAGPQPSLPPQGAPPWPAQTRVHCTWRWAAASPLALQAPNQNVASIDGQSPELDAQAGDFGDYNLALHVGDDPRRVIARRQQLLNELQGAQSTIWLNQVHGVRCVEITAATPTVVAEPTDQFTADAAWTRENGVALAVMTADCLPVLFTDRAGSLAAVAHAGWRGLCAGVIPALVQQLPVAAAELYAFIGPAISAPRYEVGAEVAHAFQAAGLADPDTVRPRGSGKFHVDLVRAVRSQLRDLGVGSVTGGHWCTAAQACFYSHRRYRQRVDKDHSENRSENAPEHTGRQACLVWLP